MIDFPIITPGGKLRDSSEAEPEGSSMCRISEISIHHSRRNHLVTDEEFLRAFEECRIPKAFWTHEAHVRMAWLYLRRNGRTDFPGFAGRHPDLLDRKLSALLDHDIRDLLFSTQAVERFVEPDLLPLPRRVNESPGG
jgi:hypothetical protein